MTQHISIILAVPSISVEKYSELTRLSIDTINDMLSDRRLKRHRLRKDKKREKVMINIAAMTIDALSLHATNGALARSTFSDTQSHP